MSEWKSVKISDFCTITRGGSPRPIHEYITETGTPWVKIADATESGSRFITSTKEFIKPEGELKSRVVFPGDFILSNSATPGIPRFMKIRACIHDGWLLIRDINGVDQLFLYYLLLTEREALLVQGNGSIFTNLKTDILKEHKVLLPPLPEQKAIAAVLSSLDDKIDLLHRQNKTLEAMAETLFRQWFVEEADEGWEEVPLSFFAENIRENVKVENLSDHEHYVGLEHIPRKRVILDSWSTTDSIESNKSTFKKYDILFGKLRSYFHKVVYTPIGGVCSTDILVIRPKKEHWQPFCLFWFFSKDVVEHSDLGSGGTRMPRTNWEIVSSYKVPCPPEELIIEFDRIIRSSLNKMFQNINAIRTLEKLRDTLLPKLMSGEVRVKV